MENTDQIINSALSPQEKEKLFKHTGNCAVNAARQFVPSFIVDEALKPAMRALILYFTNDPRFEEEGNGKLSKGIFLCGNVGTGKTILMQSFRDNAKKRYNVYSTNELTDTYVTGDIEALHYFLGNRDAMYGGDPKAYCFDDLGSENTSVKHMGNDLNVMERIILSRYEKKIPFYYTHFTSNIDAELVEKMYGTRVRSRLREMCNFIVIDGTDRRK